MGVLLPGERNVACLEPPGTETGDLRGAAARPGDFRLGDFSLGSRARGSPSPGGNLVGDMMLSLAKSGRACLSRPGWAGPRVAPASGLESRGEIWMERVGRSPGEVDNTCCANLGRGSDIGSELLFWVLRWLASRTGAAAVRDIRFSGFSSQSGVPGREPSEEGGGETGVRGAE